MMPNPNPSPYRRAHTVKREEEQGESVSEKEEEGGTERTRGCRTATPTLSGELTQ